MWCLIYCVLLPYILTFHWKKFSKFCSAKLYLAMLLFAVQVKLHAYLETNANKCILFYTFKTWLSNKHTALFLIHQSETNNPQTNAKCLASMKKKLSIKNFHLTFGTHFPLRILLQHFLTNALSNLASNHSRWRSKSIPIRPAGTDSGRGTLPPVTEDDDILSASPKLENCQPTGTFVVFAAEKSKVNLSLLHYLVGGIINM